MNNRLQSTISLCRRAGKLLLGFDQVKEAVEAGQVKAVFVSTDLSDKSKKEVSFFCSKHNVPAARLPLSKDEIKEAVSKGSGILGVTEDCFAKTLLQQGEALSVRED